MDKSLKEHTGGGFAAESPCGPEAAKETESPSESSPREKTSGVVLPCTLHGFTQGVRKLNMLEWEHGWNDCLSFIKRANPGVDFTVEYDTANPKYWK